ncbi:unnamed protein product [Calicophoron daubneyi]|uniref:Serpin domain-containing protein n=1 Tax=Calicophoron daubneyi TaxID=300641 RepID=A0AAV2TY63_CALDB
MDEERQYVRSPLSAFTTGLYAEFIKQQNESTLSNILVSPVSVWIAMSMMEAGCRGDTRKEMISALRMPAQFEDDKLHTIISNRLMKCFDCNHGVQISFAGRLFVLKYARIEKRFKTIVQRCYKSDVEEIANLESLIAKRNRINIWVLDNTHRKIKELVPAEMVNNDTSLMLINTVYFRGMWSRVFDRAETHDAEFHKLDGSTVKVKMMHTIGWYPFTRLSKLNAKALKIPFQQTEWEMLIALPNGVNGLPTLLSYLQKPGAIDSLLRSHFRESNIVLRLPRLRLGEESALDLKGTLRSLGISSLFEKDKADMTGMCGRRSLFLSEVVHRAILEVDEEGTRAAGYAAHSVLPAMKMKPPYRITVDHPFVLAIVHRNSTPVFIGHVVCPNSSAI